jgi:hypothetical protein
MTAGGSNTKALGILLYTEYVYPLQIAAVILLVAIDRRHRAHAAPAQGHQVHRPVRQVRVKSRDRLQLVKMTPRSRAAACACARTGPDGRSPLRRRRHDSDPPSLPVAGRDAVRAVGDRHLPEPQEPDRAADGIELMLLAVNMNFVAFSHYLGDMHGQVFVFFILTVAAAESAIGLAILVLLFRNKSSINVDELNTLKG